jgi:hypothetical protein
MNCPIEHWKRNYLGGVEINRKAVNMLITMKRESWRNASQTAFFLDSVLVGLSLDVFRETAAFSSGGGCFCRRPSPFFKQ